MARSIRFPGECQYCGAEVGKSSSAQHLATCPKRKAELRSDAAPKTQPFPIEIYQLRVEATHLPEFWLDLEVRGDADLEAVDKYLRAIWLECCGHASAFSLKGWGSPELAKEGSVGDVFKHLRQIMHVYDFGTESWTTLKRVSVRKSRGQYRYPVKLLVRNKLPAVVCQECGKPATRLCVQCVVEDDVITWFCARHAKEHDHHDYGPALRVVNSPRLGLCGYNGPAKPPY